MLYCVSLPSCLANSHLKTEAHLKLLFMCTPAQVVKKRSRRTLSVLRVNLLYNNDPMCLSGTKLHWNSTGQLHYCPFHTFLRHAQLSLKVNPHRTAALVCSNKNSNEPSSIIQGDSKYIYSEPHWTQYSLFFNNFIFDALNCLY